MDKDSRIVSGDRILFGATIFLLSFQRAKIKEE